AFHVTGVPTCALPISTTTAAAAAVRIQRVRDPPRPCFPAAVIGLRPLMRAGFGFGGSGCAAACAASSVSRPRPCASQDGPYAEGSGERRVGSELGAVA